MVAANHFNRNDVLVPRPESVLLTNLRQVVLALSDPNTPEAYRVRFDANNPIPEAAKGVQTPTPPGYTTVATYGVFVFSGVRSRK